MFQIDSDMTIYITRGDVAYFTVTAENEGVKHKFKPGDVVRIKVFAKKDCTNVAFQKDFPVLEETEKVDILLTEEETKIGDVISKPVDYWYEIELNPYSNPQTIVGYDDDGAKIFKLFPEGRDLGPTEISEEDIPVVDAELLLTSDRPVQNQAIARAIIGLSADVKNAIAEEAKVIAVVKEKVNEVSKDVEKLDNTLNTETSRLNNSLAAETARLDNELAVERARINNLTANTGEQTEGNAELIDTRVGADGKTYSTAGEAVRGQIGQLSGYIENERDVVRGIQNNAGIPFLECEVGATQTIFSYDRPCKSGTVISATVEDVKANFTGVVAISIQKRIEGEWKTLIGVNSPTTSSITTITLDTDVDNVRVVGLIVGDGATVTDFSAKCKLYFGYPKEVTVGADGVFKSILSALKDTPDDVAIRVLKGTYDIYNEYLEYYGDDYWDNYTGYDGKTDLFTRGLWLSKGRRIYGESGAKLTFSSPKTNSNIASYFSIFANDTNVEIDNIIIDIGDRTVRYAIHDDFQPKGGNVIFRNLIFRGTPRTGAVIGAGLGVDTTYLIENCIFEEHNGTYDISYHGNTNSKVTDNQCKLTVINCYGTKECWFGWYGASTTKSTCIVNNSRFSKVSCTAMNENQTNENMQLIAYKNEVD